MWHVGSELKVIVKVLHGNGQKNRFNFFVIHRQKNEITMKIWVEKYTEGKVITNTWEISIMEAERSTNH